VQLGAFRLEALTSMLQGIVSLSADDLLGCFELPRSSDAEAAAAGFALAGSKADRFFEEVVKDDASLGTLASESPHTSPAGPDAAQVCIWSSLARARRDCATLPAAVVHSARRVARRRPTRLQDPFAAVWS
jgi:hypothetical protein